jgi:hypothetical protein
VKLIPEPFNINEVQVSGQLQFMTRTGSAVSQLHAHLAMEMRIMEGISTGDLDTFSLSYFSSFSKKFRFHL